MILSLRGTRIINESALRVIAIAAWTFAAGLGQVTLLNCDELKLARYEDVIIGALPSAAVFAMALAIGFAMHILQGGKI
jgi:uncharacterized membrane protein (Fun14 family)